MPSNQEQMVQFLDMTRMVPEGTDPLFVEVQPASKEVRELWDFISFKGCFNNAYRCMAGTGANYVLGYAAGIIPVEHAWIEIDGIHYDPTWEKYSEIGHTYAQLIKLNPTELINITCKNDDVPPCLWDLNRLEIISPKPLPQLG